MCNMIGAALGVSPDKWQVDKEIKSEPVLGTYESVTAAISVTDFEKVRRPYRQVSQIDLMLFGIEQIAYCPRICARLRSIENLAGRKLVSSPRDAHAISGNHSDSNRTTQLRRYGVIHERSRVGQ